MNKAQLTQATKDQLDTKNIDLIYMGLFRWNGPYSSISIALAKEFAKNNRVFYINHPFTMRDYKSMDDVELKKKLNYKVPFFEQENSNLTIVTPPISMPINWLPDGKIYDLANSYNHRIINRTIQSIIDKYQVKDYVYMNCFDPWYPTTLHSRLKPLLNIYQSVDDISTDEYIVKHGLRLENEAVKNCDLTFVTSSELLRLKSEYSDQVHTLNNAADISNFEKALDESLPVPEELKGVDKKIIGYIGNLDFLRIDYPLLKKIAEQHKDKILCLIGPLNNNKYKEIGLDRLPNVLLLGSRKIEELPPYLKRFDCTLIPFLCNTITKSIYPLKINEYLSAGKAVISTDFSEDIKSFAEHIYLAQNHDEFIKNIDRAIDENTASKARARHQVAQSNTWESRVDFFWKTVNQYLTK